MVRWGCLQKADQGTVLTNPSNVKTVAAFTACMFLCGGLILELSLGRHFVFYYADRYYAVAPGIFLLLLFFGVVRLKRNVSARAFFRRRYPTTWFRFILLYPLSLALGAAVTLSAPLGWVAAYTWAAGTQMDAGIGQILSVGEFRPASRGCDQRGELQLQNQVAAVCLEGVAPIPLNSGSQATIAGKQSHFGVLVVSVTPN